MRMVVPLREAPGNTMATNCAKPKATAMVHVIVATDAFSFSLVSGFPFRRSMIMNSTPPMSSAHAMGSGLFSSSHPAALRASPPVAVITKAVAILMR